MCAVIYLISATCTINENGFSIFKIEHYLAVWKLVVGGWRAVRYGTSTDDSSLLAVLHARGDLRASDLCGVQRARWLAYKGQRGKDRL
jgi:hypothetical protein